MIRMKDDINHGFMIGIQLKGWDHLYDYRENCRIAARVAR